MTITEVAHYWNTSVFNPENKIRVFYDEKDGWCWWNEETGEVIRSKELN